MDGARILKLSQGPQVGASPLGRSRAAANPMCAPPLVSLRLRCYVSPIHAWSTVQGMWPLPMVVSSLPHVGRPYRLHRTVLMDFSLSYQTGKGEGAVLVLRQALGLTGHTLSYSCRRLLRSLFSLSRSRPRQFTLWFSS